MLKFDFNNLFAGAIGKEGLNDMDLREIKNAVPAAHAKFTAWRESKDAIFYDIVFDENLTRGIEDRANEAAGRFENLVVLGIGGSALGFRSISQALLPPFWNLKDLRQRSGRPRIFICDNIDPETYSALMDLIDFKKTCFVVISKSGKTVETAAQFFIALERLKKELGDKWREHVVIITDPESGELRPLVKKEGLASFEIPPKLGGRFSVLSPVGLFPAACIGVDIAGLISGARSMAKLCAAADIEKNPAYQIGVYHWWMDLKKGKPMSVMMSYSDALSLCSDWYVQLMAESLGKDGKGATPIRALGATDQHSQIQLYMEGPCDKVVTFLAVEKFRVRDDATGIRETGGPFGFLSGHNLGAILNAEQRATAGALAKSGRPVFTITFPSVDAYHLGEFFMLYEIATTFSGALYGINPFDQPGVELGKKLAREILEKISKTQVRRP